MGKSLLRRGWIPALLAVLAGCGGEPPAGGVVVGRPMPEFGAPLLSGDSLTLADLRGNVVLLNVWATWCPPCREEMPGLQALHEEYESRGLRVVGVSVDAPSDGDAIREFVEQNGITFAILHDRGDQALRTFRTTGVPETYLIDREGTVLNRWIGMIDPTSDAIRGPVRDALAAGE